MTEAKLSSCLERFLAFQLPARPIDAMGRIWGRAAGGGVVSLSTSGCFLTSAAFDRSLMGDPDKFLGGLRPLEGVVAPMRGLVSLMLVANAGILH